MCPAHSFFWFAHIDSTFNKNSNLFRGKRKYSTNLILTPTPNIPNTFRNSVCTFAVNNKRGWLDLPKTKNTYYTLPVVDVAYCIDEGSKCQAGSTARECLEFIRNNFSPSNSSNNYNQVKWTMKMWASISQALI